VTDLDAHRCGSRAEGRSISEKHGPRAIDYARRVPLASARSSLVSGAIGLALVATLACACHRRTTNAAPAPSPSASASAEPARFDLELGPASFVAYGATTQLSLAGDLQESAPQLTAPMQKLARNLHGGPARMRVARNVPYGQLWRVISAGVSAGIGVWDLATPGVDGPEATVRIGAGLGLGATTCFAAAWVGPDATVVVGLEARGVLVKAHERRVPIDDVIAVVRRLDDHCAEGELRFNSQPSAAWGPVFDLVRGVGAAASPPKVRTVRLAVGHIASVDAPVEVVP
jgi:hypothetical protein